jgi:hypothetical protein
MDSMMMTRLRVEDRHREAESYRNSHPRDTEVQAPRRGTVHRVGHVLSAAAHWLIRH